MGETDARLTEYRDGPPPCAGWWEVFVVAGEQDYFAHWDEVAWSNPVKDEGGLARGGVVFATGLTPSRSPYQFKWRGLTSKPNE